MAPAAKNRIPADRKGGKPSSIPTLMAKKVVPKIKHMIQYIITVIVIPPAINCKIGWIDQMELYRPDLSKWYNNSR